MLKGPCVLRMPGTILTGISSTGMLWLRVSRASVSWTLATQLVDSGVAVGITMVIWVINGYNLHKLGYTQPLCITMVIF